MPKNGPQFSQQLTSRGYSLASYPLDLASLCDLLHLAEGGQQVYEGSEQAQWVLQSLLLFSCLGGTPGRITWKRTLASGLPSAKCVEQGHYGPLSRGWPTRLQPHE